MADMLPEPELTKMYPKSASHGGCATQLEAAALLVASEALPPALRSYVDSKVRVPNSELLRDGAMRLYWREHVPLSETCGARGLGGRGRGGS